MYEEDGSAGGSNVYDPFASTSNDAHGSLIAAELERLGSHYGFSLISDASLTYGFVSADIDHVVVDRYGVLIINAEWREDAAIVGSVQDNRWLATFADGRVTEFPNPLRQSAGAEDIVRQALGERLVILEPDQIGSVVVFINADISRLAQMETGSTKIVTLERLADMFEGRYNFPSNNGSLPAPMSPESPLPSRPWRTSARTRRLRVHWGRIPSSPSPRRTRWRLHLRPRMPRTRARFPRNLRATSPACPKAPACVPRCSP